jgi:AcrR family transcriptional regulator
MKRTLRETRLSSLVEQTKKSTDRNGRPTGRVTKLQWLEAALRALESSGVENVRVSDLARSLSISKSGFYWHFKDRADLLNEMKQYWVDEFSQQIISDTLNMAGPLRDKLINVVHRIREKENGKYDLAFASWAQRDPEVRELIERVTNIRLDFVKKLFENSDHTGDALETRARLFVLYFGWSEIVFRKTPDGPEGEDLDEILNVIIG